MKRPKKLVFFLAVGLALLSLPYVVYSEQVTIPLAKGWNFVSVAGYPVDTTIGTVLNPISGKVGVVWSYDNITKRWLWYRPQRNDSTLGYMGPGPGYWVYMNDPDTLSFWSYMDPGIVQSTIMSGWNLIGYYWTDNVDVANTFGNLKGKWKFVWGWEGGTWRAKTAPGVPVVASFQELTSLKRGAAYWVYLWPGQGRMDWSPDTYPPGLGLLLPMPEATRVPVDTQVSAQFVESLDPASVNGDTFFLKDPDNNPVAGTVTLVGGNTALFTPSADLAYLTRYTATLTTGIRDLSQNPRGEISSWSFTTRSSDFTPPTVISAIPPSGGTGVLIGSPVSATFSENMDAGTLNWETFTVKRMPSNEAVAGVVTCIENRATFTPSAGLAYGTTYTATITTGAQDRAGNGVAQDYLWNFTTENLPNQSGAGIWNGSFNSNFTGNSLCAMGMIGENNQGRFVTTSSSFCNGQYYFGQYVGNGQFAISGSSFSGLAYAYAPSGFVFPNGQTSGTVTLTGTVTTKTSISGTYSGVGDSGTFSFTYDPFYETGSSLAKTKGAWFASVSSVGHSVRVDINDAGALTGWIEGPGVCPISGSVSPINASYNLYSVNVTVHDCALPQYNGTYSGHAVLTEMDTACVLGVSSSANPAAALNATFTKQLQIQ